MKVLAWLLFFPILLPVLGARSLYRALALTNDVKAIRNGRVARRVGRRIYGRATGRLAGKLFG